jgi:hypothetical protein
MGGVVFFWRGRPVEKRKPALPLASCWFGFLRALAKWRVMKIVSAGRASTVARTPACAVDNESSWRDHTNLGEQE